jgi:hypothetical protein
VHKVTKAAALAAALAFAAAGTAEAGPNTQQVVSMKLSPSKAGTKKKPANVRLTFEAATTEPDGSQPPTITNVELYFPKELRFNPSKFATCSMADLMPGDPSVCPRASKVGTGSAEALAAAGAIRAQPALTAFNGAAGNELILYTSLQTPINLNQAISARLSKTGGAFAHKLTMPIPSNLQEPIPGIVATITKFSATIGGTVKKNGRKTGYIELVGCPRSKKLKIRGVFTTRDGQQLTAENTTPCR